MSSKPVVERMSSRLSPWVTLMERSVVHAPDLPPQIFHSLAQADYINVLAVTQDGRVPLVRQYRPAMEDFTIELPGGMAEINEAPVITAERELYEESGYRLQEPLVELGNLMPDSGRLENRFRCYFARAVESDPSWKPEDGLEMFLMDVDAFKRSVRDGAFTHALHVAAVGLAMLRGLI